LIEEFAILRRDSRPKSPYSTTWIESQQQHSVFNHIDDARKSRYCLLKFPVGQPALIYRLLTTHRIPFYKTQGPPATLRARDVVADQEEMTDHEASVFGNDMRIITQKPTVNRFGKLADLDTD
jgi:hypothetical protein